MKIDWQKVSGLIPAIIQDFDTNEVLMLGFMNEESLNLSIKTGFTHFFSRSKNRIWQKGETSGHTQKIEKIFLDCDSDTLLIKVKQIGQACHTGNKTCFFNEISIQQNEKSIQNLEKRPTNYEILDEIYHTILDRKFNANPQNSYVASLYKKGENHYLKKIAEESAEFILACKDLKKFEKYGDLGRENFGEHKENNPKFDLIYEGSDLIFHLCVALADFGIHPENLLNELKRREGLSGLEEKKSRK